MIALLIGALICALKFPGNFLFGWGASESNRAEMWSRFGLYTADEGLVDAWRRLKTNSNGRGFSHNATNLAIEWVVANRPLSIKFLFFAAFFPWVWGLVF